MLITQRQKIGVYYFIFPPPESRTKTAITLACHHHVFIDEERLDVWTNHILRTTKETLDVTRSVNVCAMLSSKRRRVQTALAWLIVETVLSLRAQG